MIKKSDCTILEKCTNTINGNMEDRVDNTNEHPLAISICFERDI